MLGTFRLRYFEHVNLFVVAVCAPPSHPLPFRLLFPFEVAKEMWKTASRRQALMVHAFEPSTWVTESDRCVWVQGQPGRSTWWDTVSKKKNIEVIDSNFLPMFVLVFESQVKARKEKAGPRPLGRSRSRRSRKQTSSAPPPCWISTTLLTTWPTACTCEASPGQALPKGKGGKNKI